MKSYKSAQPLPNFPSPLYYLMSSAPITTFIYGVYYVFICLFYIIFHQHVSSKEKESLVLFCVFLVSRIETAYRGLRLKAAKHDEKYTIRDLCKIDFDFSVAQVWNLTENRVGIVYLFDKFACTLNLCKTLCFKESTLIHTGSTKGASYCTPFLPMEEKRQLDFLVNKVVNFLFSVKIWLMLWFPVQKYKEVS